MSLISVSSARARGSSFCFVSDASHILAPEGWDQLPGKQRRKLFFLECKFRRSPIVLVTETKRDTNVALQCCGTDDWGNSTRRIFHRFPIWAS